MSAILRKNKNGKWREKLSQTLTVSQLTTYPASYQRRLHFYQTIKTEPVVIGDIIGCIIKDIWHFVASSNLYKVFLGVEDIKE